MSIQLSCVSQPASTWYAICSVCSAIALQPGQCAQQLGTALIYLICVQCCHSRLCHDSSVILQRTIHCVRMGPGLQQCLEASPSQCSVLCWMRSGRHYFCSLVTASRYAPFKLAFYLQHSLATYKIASDCSDSDYQFLLCAHMSHHLLWS